MFDDPFAPKSVMGNIAPYTPKYFYVSAMQGRAYHDEPNANVGLAAGVSRFCSIKGKRQRTLEVLVALSIAGSTMAFVDVVDLGVLTAAQSVKYNGPYSESTVRGILSLARGRTLVMAADCLAEHT